MERLKEKIKNPYILYTILFLVIWSIITLPFLLRGNSLIGQADSFNESFPIFIYIGNYIKEFLKGSFIQFDFRLGLGDDVIQTLNWHGFGDIFQIISVVASKEYAEKMYEVVMTLKLYLCGMAFLIYSKTYLQNNYYRVAGALMYALSVYALVYGLSFWTFLNPMITLPFILYGIDSIVENPSKVSCSMIFALFIQALNGFYFLYMEIIISVFYFMVIVWNHKKNRDFSWNQIIKTMLAILKQGVLGCLMGAVLLVPAISRYLSSNRVISKENAYSFISLFKFDDWAYYLRGLASILVPDVYESMITIPAIVLLGGVVLICHGKGKIAKSLMILFTFLFCMPVMGKIMNGFSYWTDRWYFAVILFLVLGTMVAVEEGYRAEKKEVIVFEAIAIVSIGVHFLNSEKTIGLAIQTIIFLLVIAALPWIWNRTVQRDIIILCSIVIIMTMDGLLVFGPKILGGSGYSAGFKAKGEAYTEISNSVEKIEKKNWDFQRIDIYESSLAAALVMDYYGTTEYFSMLNANVSEFYREMYISPGVRSASFILKGLDRRYELEALLSTSQYMDFKTDENGELQAVIRETEDKLSLGFAYTQYMDRTEFDKLNAIEKLSAMSNYLVVEKPIEKSTGLSEVFADEAIDSKVNKEIPIELYEIEVEHNGRKIITNEESKIRVYLKNIDETKEYYVKLSDFCLLESGTQDIYVGNKNIQLRNKNEPYYIGPDEFWVHVSEFMKDKNGAYFDIRFNGNKSFTLGKIQVYVHTPDQNAILNRNNIVLNDLELGINTIQGKIAVDKNQALFLSIPYSKGWKAYVDGEKTEIERANIAFMALALEPGEHEVILKYKTPGLQAGLVISVVSVIIVILWIVLQRRKTKRS